MDRKLMAAIATLILVALVVAAIVSGQTEDQAKSATARFDEASGQCVGDEPVSRQRCEGQVAQLESTLVNAATAEESYFTVNKGEYTESIADLEAEGLQVPPQVVLTIVSALDQQYCLEATSEQLDATFHYSSTVGTPEPGSCQ